MRRLRATRMGADLAAALRAEGLDASPWSNGPGDRYPRHRHDYDKVIVVERGSIAFGLDDGRSIDLATGDGLELAAGSQDALAALYDRHADAIYATASRLTSDRHIAEEVVQETFLALWNRAELFNPAAGSLAAWLHTIARNRTVDRLRALGRRPSLLPL